jgi:hypothetical protein
VNHLRVWALSGTSRYDPAKACPCRWYLQAQDPPNLDSPVPSTFDRLQFFSSLLLLLLPSPCKPCQCLPLHCTSTCHQTDCYRGIGIYTLEDNAARTDANVINNHFTSKETKTCRMRSLQTPIAMQKRPYHNSNLSLLRSSVDDLDLDGSLSRISGDVESLDGLFQGESVGDQRLEVDQSSGD